MVSMNIDTVRISSLCAQLLDAKNEQDPRTLPPIVGSALKSIAQTAQSWWRVAVDVPPRGRWLTPQETASIQLNILGQIDDQLKSPHIPSQAPDSWEELAIMRDIRHIVHKVLVGLLKETPQDQVALRSKIQAVIADSAAALVKEESYYNKSEFKQIKEFRDIARKVANRIFEANNTQNLTTKTCMNKTWGVIDPTAPYRLNGADWIKDEYELGPYKIGFACMRGRRQYMEDRELCTHCGPNNEYPLIALFDGHTGSECAQFLARQLPHAITEGLKNITTTDPQEREVEIYNFLQTVFIKLEEKFKKAFPNSIAGSTALFVLMMGETMWVVNCGDTRGVIVSPNRLGSTGKIIGGEVTQLTEDAKPDKPRFKRGVTKRGGRVVTYKDGSPARVNGRLAIARSVGDVTVGKGVTALADVTPIPINIIPKGSHLILATDGVWDVGSTAEVAKTVKEMMGFSFPPEVAEEVMLTAYKSGSMDNTSVIDVVF